MNVHLQVKLPESVVSAIDELSNGTSRSQYVRLVIDGYTLSKTLLFEMFEAQYKCFQTSTSSLEHTEKVKSTTAIVDHIQLERLKRLSASLNLSQDALLRSIFHHHVMTNRNAENPSSPE